MLTTKFACFNALDELQARVIAVPPFEIEYLQRGHAVHFRCLRPDAGNQLVDIMAVMRGVAPFEELWGRRATVLLPDFSVELMALPDLVLAKKTQRHKDWPMLEQLLSVHYFENRETPTPQQIEFWLRELRTSEYLYEVAARFPAEAAHLASQCVT